MKTDYSAYPSEQLQGERRKLHRKLILPNIFILLISLVAAASLLFGSFCPFRYISTRNSGKRLRR